MKNLSCVSAKLCSSSHENLPLLAQEKDQEGVALVWNGHRPKLPNFSFLSESTPGVCVFSLQLAPLGTQDMAKCTEPWPVRPMWALVQIATTPLLTQLPVRCLRKSNGKWLRCLCPCHLSGTLYQEKFQASGFHVAHHQPFQPFGVWICRCKIPLFFSDFPSLFEILSFK